MWRNSLLKVLSFTTATAVAVLGLAVAPAAATPPPIVIGDGSSLVPHGSDTLPITLNYDTETLLKVRLEIANAEIDMAGETASDNITILEGCVDWCDSVTFLATTTATKAFLSGLKVFREAVTAKDAWVSISVTNPILVDPATGHGYLKVDSYWDFNLARCRAKYTNAYYDESALSADKCMPYDLELVPNTFNGTTGHLLTIDNAAEQTFIESINSGNDSDYYWMGGADTDTPDVWKWLDGPSAGNTFWNGGSVVDGGSAPDGVYTNFENGHPYIESFASDFDALLLQDNNLWSSNVVGNGYKSIVEYEGVALEALDIDLYQYGSISTEWTNNECLTLHPDMSYIRFSAGNNDAWYWWELDGIEINEQETFNDVWNYADQDYISDDTFDTVNFSLPQTNDIYSACVSLDAAGNLHVKADSESNYSDNGLKIEFETVIFADGATSRQTVTYINTDEANSFTPSNLYFYANYGTDENETIVANESYGALFTGDEDASLITALWGGAGTTIKASSPRLADLPAIDQDLPPGQAKVAIDRFSSLKDIPSAYFEGISGNISNWGGGATVNSVDDSNLGNYSLEFVIPSVAPLSRSSVVVFHDTRGIQGWVDFARWDSDIVPSSVDVMVGQYFEGYFNRTDAIEVDDYEITYNSLPAGLTLDGDTGLISGTVTADPGEYYVDITATSQDAKYDRFAEPDTKSILFNVVVAGSNTSFEGTLASWNRIHDRVDLGESYIAGCKTVDTTDYSTLEELSGGFYESDLRVANRERAGVEDNNSPQSYGTSSDTYYTHLTSDEYTDGEYALGLYSDIDKTYNGYDVVHGPAVYSPVFEATSSHTVAFDWMATDDSDYYAVLGYLLNVETCAQTEIIDSIGEKTDWVTEEVVVPAAGTYRFVFVAGTYDRSGGTAAGAELFLDNFQLGLAEAPVWTDEEIADGELGVDYSDAIDASGFPHPAITVNRGSLPDGVSMTIGGAIRGTPNMQGQYRLEFKAENGSGSITTQVEHIVANPGAVWVDAEIGDLTKGSAFSDGVQAFATGTTTTYSIDGGELPDGLALNTETGAITGTPTTAGDYYFVVKAVAGDNTIYTAFSGWVNDGEGGEEEDGEDVPTTDVAPELPGWKQIQPLPAGKAAKVRLFDLLPSTETIAEVKNSVLIGGFKTVRPIHLGITTKATTTIKQNTVIQVDSKLPADTNLVHGYLQMPNGTWFDLGVGKPTKGSTRLATTKFIKPGRYVIAFTVVKTGVTPKAQLTSLAVTPAWGISTQQLVVNVIKPANQSSVLFKINSYKLTDAAKKYLRTLTPKLRGANAITLSGYTQTDVQAGPGNAGSRWLAKKRANAVAAYMKALGLDVTIKIKYYGAKIPASKKQWLNRRVEIQVS